MPQIPGGIYISERALLILASLALAVVKLLIG